jgi:hypothetical protein
LAFDEGLFVVFSIATTRESNKRALLFLSLFLSRAPKDHVFFPPRRKKSADERIVVVVVVLLLLRQKRE